MFGNKKPSKNFRHFSAGGFQQLAIETVDDLRLIKDFDFKLWVCLSAPVAKQEIRETTLEWMDKDRDGYFRCSEVVEAVEWVLRVLKDPSTLNQNLEKFKLAQINEEESLGRNILKGAKHVLSILEKTDDFISLSDVKKIRRKIAADSSIKCEHLDELEKALRYHRDIFPIVNNFISLPYFYRYTKKASFQAGTLYMNGCSYHLCVNVDDIEQHAPLAEKSGLFVAYCEIKRAGVEEPKVIAVAVTGHKGDRIVEGIRGVFYDRQNRDWNAKVIRVIRNPISLWEAFVAPFKALFKFIGEQFKKITQSQKKALETQIETGITQQPGAQPPSNIGALLAGGGVALAALSSAFAYISTEFAETNLLRLFTGFLIIIAIISLPSVISGWIKLRSRDVGLLLQASGWAINARMRLPRDLAMNLTRVGHFPSNCLNRLWLALVEK